MFIFVVLTEKEKDETKKSRKNRMDSDYASLFDRMTDTNIDSKYNPENAIIRSSMSSSSTTANNHSKQSRKIFSTIFFFCFLNLLSLIFAFLYEMSI